jgi:ABC-2 type transport system ATP-binding protein
MNGEQLMLEAVDLWKSYSGTPAVAGVTLSAGPGEIVGLLGPNGAGKSTIIAMACGLLLPDRGTVTIAGEPLTGDDGEAKRKIGLVPQEIALHEQLSAIANLRLFGALYGIAGTLLDDRATAASTTATRTPSPEWGCSSCSSWASSWVSACC